MRKILLVLLLFVSACATEENFRNILYQYNGLTKKQVVMRLGIPHKTYNVSGMEVLEYDFSKTSYIHPQTHVYGNTSGNNAYVNSYTYGGYYNTKYCNISFFFERGRVVHWRYEGNDCKA